MRDEFRFSEQKKLLVKKKKKPEYNWRYDSYWMTTEEREILQQRTL